MQPQLPKTENNDCFFIPHGQRGGFVTVRDILRTEAMHTAEIRAGAAGLEREVTGIMVLEAADIENWGQAGELILSSYYALQSLDAPALAAFADKLIKLDISGLILKLDRLIASVPELLITLCNERALPLICIPAQTGYDAVILSTLTPLLNQNAALLQRHYEAQSKFSRLALQHPSIEQILQELLRMIGCHSSFFSSDPQSVIGTKRDLDNFRELSRSPLPPSKYRNFTYYRIALYYPADGTRQEALAVTVPGSELSPCSLVIHTRERMLSEDDYMIVETVVGFLQMELLKQAAVSRQIFHRNNTVMQDIFSGRHGEVMNSRLLLELGIGQHPHYQLVFLRLYPRPSAAEDILSGRFFRTLQNLTRQRWGHRAYLGAGDRITFVVNFPSSVGQLFEKDVLSLMEDVKAACPESVFSYRAAISRVGSAAEIPQLYQQVLNIYSQQKRLRQINAALSYDEMGIYKLFLEKEQLEKIPQYIPEALIRYYHREPEMFRTLECFLRSNQNLTATANDLFLHPKTVRYRIDKIVRQLEIDLTDPRKTFDLQFYAHLLLLLPEDYTDENV